MDRNYSAHLVFRFSRKSFTPRRRIYTILIGARGEGKGARFGAQMK